MPELPEVETIRRGLEKYIVGYRIADVEVRLPRIVRGEIASVIGGVVTGIRRYGKGLVIDLDNSYSLAVHVKMTGQLVYRKKNSNLKSQKSKPQLNVQSLQEYPNKWTHVVFKLKSQKSKIKVTDKNLKIQEDDEAVLYYSDVRQFGWIHAIPTADLKQLSFFQTIGPEPLRDLDLTRFKKILHSRNTPIKILLMDQQKIAGVGNIYANDSLYLAGIHPLRKASSLTENEVAKLFSALEVVLQKSIDLGGTSASNYVNVLGERGGYQKHFLVYQKTGELCKHCGSAIERIVVGGRSTFFCPECQK
jgi:formamidopyrimidine-DNA glycosylase